jgi:hypothetical protein
MTAVRFRERAVRMGDIGMHETEIGHLWKSFSTSRFVDLQRPMSLQ